MNFATWSIRNPIPAILLFVMLTLAGLVGFHRLPIREMPDIKFPLVQVILSQPGAAPAQLETEVVRKVENALAPMTGVHHLDTNISDGQVSIFVEFTLETNLSEALIETKNTVDSIRPDLPADLQEPVVVAPNLEDPILGYAIASRTMDQQALSWYVDDIVAKTVLSVPGVGRFDRIGGVQRQVRIEVDPVQMAALGVNALDVSHAIRNMQQQSSGGRTQLGQAEQSVRTIATVRQAQDLASFPVPMGSGREVRLDQFARISDTHAELTQVALVDGKPVVGFNISAAKGFDETRVAAAVRETLGKLATQNPDLTLVPIGGSVSSTEEEYTGSMHMLYEGAILAILVVWWFLRNWRATLVAASALPLSILPAFAAMSWLGFSLNTITLLALALVVGILVDDAIVEIENIERHAQMGKPIRLAVEEAVNEIALAVIATTMTLVAVFLPTSLMPGVPGLFFRQFGWTAVIAVLTSLLVARVLTPMMAAQLLKVHPVEHREDGLIMRRYLQGVRWCLGHRKTTLLAATLFFIGSLALVPMIPSALVPPDDGDTSAVNISLPPGSSLATTTAVAEATRQALLPIAGIQHVFTMIGANDDGSAGEVRSGTLNLILAPRGSRLSKMVIEKAVRAALVQVPGARFTVGDGGSGEQLQLVLASDDETALKSSALALEQQLRGVGTLANISSTASLERPEVIVRPDLQRASELGVSSADIGEIVRISSSGDFTMNLAKLNLDNRQIDINVSMPNADRQDLTMLSNLRIPTAKGAVPLSSIASLRLESGPSEIKRHDRRRYVTFSADLNGMHLSDALAAAYQLPALKGLPPDVSLILDGDAGTAEEMTSGFLTAIGVGILCVYCVLVLLFRDFLQPITILSAIPLSLGGALVALMVARSELSIPSMIGLVMLMGIVTKNSILLAEYAVMGIRERGLSLQDALLDACHKRARPIVMTTVAMIAGMLPIALGLGADASFRQPMAVAVIGGLITSTCLSLLVVPVVFTYIDGFEHKMIKLVRRKRSRLSDAAVAVAPAPAPSFPADLQP